MALPAGRYGVTKNQLLKIKKLPMNTIKLIEELTEKFDLLGTAAFKNSTSVVTDSSDLVESGAVKDIVGWGNKNLLPNDMTTQTVNGITFSVQEDKSVIANGTASADWARVYFAFDTHLPVGDYLLSGVTDGAANTYRIAIELSDDTSVGVYDGDASFSIAQGVYITQAYVAIRMAGYVANNVVFKPMIRKATVTDSTYEPYHASVEESKTDNSVIGTVEGANASQDYAVGQHFIRDGAFCTCTQPIAQGGSFILGTNYTVGDVADELKTVTETYNFEIDDASVPFTFYRFGKIVIASVSYSTSALTIPTTWTPVNVTVSEAFRKSATNFIPVICPNGKIVYIRITVYGIVDISSVDGSSIWLQGSGVTTV